MAGEHHAAGTAEERLARLRRERLAAGHALERHEIQEHRRGRDVGPPCHQQDPMRQRARHRVGWIADFAGQLARSPTIRRTRRRPRSTRRPGHPRAAAIPRAARRRARSSPVAAADREAADDNHRQRAELEHASARPATDAPVWLPTMFSAAATRMAPTATSFIVAGPIGTRYAA